MHILGHLFPLQFINVTLYFWQPLAFLHFLVEPISYHYFFMWSLISKWNEHRCSEIFADCFPKGTLLRLIKNNVKCLKLNYCLANMHCLERRCLQTSFNFYERSNVLFIEMQKQPSTFDNINLPTWRFFSSGQRGKTAFTHTQDLCKVLSPFVLT